MNSDYPKLRPVEAIPAQENMICLRDPLGFSDKILLLHPEAFFIVSMFDGLHSIRDIQAAYTRRFGDLLFSDKIRSLVEQLDSALFLDSDLFRTTRDRMVQEFRRASVRPFSHAGISYETDGEALRKQLDELFSALGGGDPDPPPGTLRGLIAPHIDIRRGGQCFASAYSELIRSSVASTFVILGISHVPTNRRFVLTEKDYDTPLGPVTADREFIQALAKGCDVDFFEDEFVHRNEHSVEFQAIFLRYIFGERGDVRIVPVLCASQDEVLTGKSPGEYTEFQEFAGSLKALLKERGEQVCCIAGVDLSHLGQRFGQNLTLTSTFLKRAEEDDMDMIKKILDRDAEGFFRHIYDERDRRNVCGVPAIYTLLKLVDADCTRLLRYAQSVEEQTQSVVTFMAAGLYG